MVSKVYAVIWSLFALTAAVLFVTGNFSIMTAIVFGFTAFGLVFIGMMFVLPFSITHTVPAPPKNEASRKVVTNAVPASKPAKQALTGRLV